MKKECPQTLGCIVEKICVLCGWGIETIRHMIQGIEGKEREGIKQTGHGHAMPSLGG